MTVIYADVPPNRSVASASEITGGAVVRAHHFADATSLYHWCLGRGAALVPAYYPDLGTSLGVAGGDYVFRFRTKPRFQAWNRVWFVWARSSASTATGELSITAGASATLETPVPYSRTNAPISYIEELSAQAEADPTDFTLTLSAAVGSIIVESIACFEVPRTRMPVGTSDLSIELSSFLPGRPIWSDSAGVPPGVYRMLDTIDTTASIGRRVGHLMWAVPEASAATTTDTAYMPLFRLPVPLLGRRLDVAATTQTLTMWAYCKSATAGETVSVKIAGTGFGTGIATRTSTSFGWASATFTVPVHDMTTADGRIAGAWSDAAMTFKITSGVGSKAHVAAVCIYEA